MLTGPPIVGHETVIREFAKVIIEEAPVLCGLAILEISTIRPRRSKSYRGMQSFARKSISLRGRGY